MGQINRFKTVLLAMCLSLLSACGPGQLFGPTFSPTSTPTSSHTLTPTPTQTHTPTNTPTSTPTNTFTPTPDCMAASGEWETKETVNFFGGYIPILSFTVESCKIAGWTLFAYPLPGELFLMAGTTALPIVNDQFTEENVSEFGKFTIQGTFDAATSCKGSLYFPKGFSVFGAVLSKDVTIAWTAFPK